MVKFMVLLFKFRNYPKYDEIPHIYKFSNYPRHFGTLMKMQSHESADAHALKIAILMIYFTNMIDGLHS